MLPASWSGAFPACVHDLPQHAAVDLPCTPTVRCSEFCFSEGFIAVGTPHFVDQWPSTWGTRRLPVGYVKGGEGIFSALFWVQFI
jgi:hypothetical protein